MDSEAAIEACMYLIRDEYKVLILVLMEDGLGVLSLRG